MKASPPTPPPDSAKAYWNARWQQGETGWDLGAPSPAIIHFMESYPDKSAAILIPGCGSAYEAMALATLGFRNITLLDIAPEAIARLRKTSSHIPQLHVLEQDFFHHKGRYDLILEQTFFCAIPPEKRREYALQAATLLLPQGRLAGLLFNKEFEKTGPPFGGSAAAYQQLFSPHFDIHKMEPCYNSIPPRAGSELFINLLKK